MTYLVVGMGKSGTSAVRLLKSRGHEVHAFDDLKSSMPEDLSDVPLFSKELFSKELFNKELTPFSYEGVVASPGLPLGHWVLNQARERRIPILSELDLALLGYQGKVVAVTGTNGKSTTSSLVYHLLRQLGKQVAFGGNIGTALSELALSGLPDYLVLEISSYQAQGSFLIAPSVTVFCNFSPDHLDMHGTLEEYFRAKMHLVDQTLPDGHFITESHVLQRMKSQGCLYPKNTSVSDQLEASFYDKIRSFFHLKEPHNIKNAAQAILAVAALLNQKPEDMLPYLSSFVGLAHRCERVGSVGHTSVINDSKSTNVDSTLTALTAYSGNILLLIGGRPKKESMTPILDHIHKISRIVTFGEASGQVKKELSQIPIFEVSHMEDLPDFLARHPLTEDVLLLSPACASFDQFKNFEERGQRFKIIMQRLPGFIPISG